MAERIIDPEDANQWISGMRAELWNTLCLKTKVQRVLAFTALLVGHFFSFLHHLKGFDGTLNPLKNFWPLWFLKEIMDKTMEDDILN